MAVTVEASGTLSSNVGSEDTLHTDAEAKTFVLTVDLNALAAGEVVELRVKRKVLTAGTTRTVFYAVYSGSLLGEEKIAFSPPITSAFEYVATLKQIGGSTRNFPWSVESV